MCFVIDSDSLAYYLLFNIPIFIYIIFFIYTLIRFEIGIEKRKPVIVLDSEQNLLPKP